MRRISEDAFRDLEAAVEKVKELEAELACLRAEHQRHIAQCDPNADDVISSYADTIVQQEAGLRPLCEAAEAYLDAVDREQDGDTVDLQGAEYQRLRICLRSIPTPPLDISGVVPESGAGETLEEHDKRCPTCRGYLEGLSPSSPAPAPPPSSLCGCGHPEEDHTENDECKFCPNCLRYVPRQPHRGGE